MSAPVITVLMPVFNAESFLREAIESVLAQSFREFELLAIDDGSHDGSAAILEEFRDARLRVIRNDRNRGLVETLNRGLAESRGEWIARQDSDDASHPERLRSQLGFVRGNPALSLIGADARLVDEKGRTAGRWRTGGHADLVAWDLCFRTPFCHSTAFFRRDSAAKLGGYRALPACEDYDLWSRMAMEVPVVTLREPLVKYRLHQRSVMATTRKTGDEAANASLREALKKYLRKVCPGLSASVVDDVVMPWTGQEDVEWPAYFDAVEEMERMFLRGRRPPPGFERLCADQNYMLWNRASHRNAFARALLRQSPAVAFRMPWLRMAAASFLR